MRILRNADYDYASNGVSEANGYTKWYDWNIVKKHIRIINIVITTLLGAIFTSGVIKIVFLYLLILSSFGSYTDIYMFFYSMKHIGKNDIVFGLYKKEN